MRPLNGLHVLILRARPSRAENLFSQTTSSTKGKGKGKNQNEATDPLAQGLENLGATCHTYPMMKIIPAPFDDPIIKEHILRAPQYHKAIVISQRAAQFALHWLEHHHSTLPDKIEYYAIGASSAAPLRNKGLTVHTPKTRFSSEGLLELPTLQEIKAQKILLFKGQNGRQLLARTLRARGAQLDCCELYQRRADTTFLHAIDTLLETEQTVTIAHSGEVLDTLLSTLKPKSLNTLKSRPLIVPGQRVADIARAAGFTSVHPAVSALTADMEHTVFDWYTATQQ